MSTLNLRELEKKAFKSYHEDGLFELFIGILMLVRTLGNVLDNDALRTAITVPLMVVIAPLSYVLGKKYITAPRMGYVKYGKNRMRRIELMMLSIFFILLLVAVVGFFGKAEAAGSQKFIFGAVIALVQVSIFSAIAYFLDYRRLYIVAILLGIGEPLHFVLSQYTNIAQIALYKNGIPAIIILAMGLSACCAFVKKYPRDMKGLDNAA